MASTVSPGAVRRIAVDVEAALRAAGTPQRAAKEKEYLKSDLAFVGTSMPRINTVVRDTLRDGPDLDHTGLVALVDALWVRPIHECRMAAVEFLTRRASLLTVADLPLLERLVRESGTWALVDGLAASVTGPVVAADPAGTAPVLDRWAGDGDFWVRRASLLAELGPIRAGDAAAFARFTTRADPMLPEREFFIRKAIGWVLREAGKRRPADVVAWLAPRTGRASGVTMREAVKYLPEADASRLMAAYRQATGRARPAG